MVDMAGQSSEPSGSIPEHEDRLVARNAKISAADRELEDIITGAYENAVNSKARLTRISEEIEQRAAAQESLPDDSPMVGRELHQFLLAKQQEIAKIITDAAADAAARRDRLRQVSFDDSTSPQA